MSYHELWPYPLLLCTRVTRASIWIDKVKSNFKWTLRDSMHIFSFFNRTLDKFVHIFPKRDTPKIFIRFIEFIKSKLFCCPWKYSSEWINWIAFDGSIQLRDKNSFRSWILRGICMGRSRGRKVQFVVLNQHHNKCHSPNCLLIVARQAVVKCYANIWS